MPTTQLTPQQANTYKQAVFAYLTTPIDFSKLHIPLANPMPANFAIITPDGTHKAPGHITVQDLISVNHRGTVANADITKVLVGFDHYIYTSGQLDFEDWANQAGLDLGSAMSIANQWKVAGLPAIGGQNPPRIMGVVGGKIFSDIVTGKLFITKVEDLDPYVNPYAGLPVSTPTTGTTTPTTGTTTPSTGTAGTPTPADLLEMQKEVYNKLTEVVDFSKIANLPTNFAITLPDGSKHTKGQITIQDLIYAIKRASVPLTANQDFGVDGYTGKDSANFIGFAEDILGGDMSQIASFLSKICVPEEFTLLWGYQTITTAPSPISNTITPLQQSIFDYLVAKIGKTSMPDATRAEIAQGGPSGPVLSPAYKEFMSNHLLPDQFVLDIIKLGATQQQAHDIINGIARHGLWDGTPVSAMKVEDLSKYLNPGSATYTPSPALRTATPINPLAPGRYVEFLSNARNTLISIYQDIYNGHLLTKPEDVAIILSNITIRVLFQAIIP